MIINAYDEQLSIFFSELSFFNSSRSQNPLSDQKKKPKLGQIFTPPILAGFMASLIKESINQQASVLDPCIGPNTFYKHFQDIAKEHQLTGIEIDADLISAEIKDFYIETNNQLIEGSFFDHSLGNKYDLIIMNPPYVRQELIINGDNVKHDTNLEMANMRNIIPSKSNLYVYFLLKSILHLNEGGRLVAVIYDSWLYSSFGEFLKKMFIELGELQSIYHFKHSVFPDAEVGATVIEFVRPKSINKKKEIYYYSLNSLKDIQKYKKIALKESICIRKNQLLSWNFNGLSAIDFKSDFFDLLHSKTSQPIQRGISSLANKYFIHSEKKFPESRPIIKDVSKIKSYKVQNELSFFLPINGSISTKTKSYLNSVKHEILSNEDSYKALKEKIRSRDDWFKIRIKEPGNFVFNYYLRNNIDFIYNPDLEYASDNFYILNISGDPMLLLAILNASISRLSVLRHSRSQGNGLRKIQLYEFKAVEIPNHRCFATDTVSKLIKLGGKLQSVDRYSQEPKYIIRQIDQLLIKEYNKSTGEDISITDIEKEISKLIRSDRNDESLV